MIEFHLHFFDNIGEDSISVQKVNRLADTTKFLKSLFSHFKAIVKHRKTKGILHAKEILGHKSFNNTLIYTQLVNFKDEDFTAKIAHTEEEVCKLV